MRRVLRWSPIAILLWSTTVVAQSLPALPGAPLRLKELVKDVSAKQTVAPGASLQNVEVETTTVLPIATAAATLCRAASPTECLAPPALGGVADTSAPWNADSLDGRAVMIRNLGPGALALRAEDTGSTAHWRLAQSRVLAAGEVAVLVYDGATARWQVVGARTSPIARADGR